VSGRSRPRPGRGRGPRFELIAPSASPEETAAIVAALERFMRETAPPRATPPPSGRADRWRRVAMLEAVQDEWEGDCGDLREPWINT
jgi:hypothetical protein